MSGIDKMRDKIKKKMAFDLPTPVYAEAEEDNTKVQSALQTDVRSQDDPNIKRMEFLAEHQSKSKLSEETVQSAVQQYSNTDKQQNSKKSFTEKKVTFYLSEDLYNAFNSIYAQRMLQGRNTMKAALFCEALELLIQKENNRSL